MKKVLLFTLVLLLSAGMVFAGGSKEKGESDGKADGGKQFIVIKSSSIGGSWYACGAAFAKLISDNTKYVAMNSASPGLTNESIKAMMDGKAQLGLADAEAAYAAFKGKDPWTAPVAVNNLFTIWPGVFNVIVGADTNINTLADLKGKSIATYVEGEPSGIAFMDLLSWVGVTDKNSRVYRIMKNDATRMFIDGQADCLIYAFGHGHAKLKEITTARKVRFLPTDEANVKKFIEKYPFYTSEQFGSEFGVPDAQQFISPYFIACLDTLPADQAYEFTKVWWENWKFLEEALPSNVPYINRNNPKGDLPFPLHPGSEKYFKEKGIIK